jgi:HD-GYP domain-containing protein (c-di-GMP phosphodiesterase class II)
MFEALTTTRPYQGRCKPADALVLLQRHADRGWLAPRVVHAMSRVVQSLQGRETRVPVIGPSVHGLEPTHTN